MKIPALCQQAAFEAAGLEYKFAPCYFAAVSIFSVTRYSRFGFSRWFVCTFPGHPGHESNFGFN